MRTIAITLTTLLIPTFALADTPNGTWKWSMDLQDQTINSVIMLEADGKQITGKYKDQNVEAEITDGKIDGNKLTFRIATQYNGADIGAKFAGQLKDSSIDGEIELFLNGNSVANKEWAAKRFVGKDELVGTWNFEFTAPDGTTYQPTLEVTEKAGKIVGALSGNDIGELKVKGAQFSFDTKVDYSGTPMALTYICSPAGNTISGVLKYEVQGNTGEFEIAATRKALSSATRAMLGNWKFEFTGPDGIDRTSELTLSDAGGELEAKLVTDGNNHEVHDLETKGKSVSFGFDVNHDGMEVKLTWESEMSSEDKMEGTLAFDVDGNVGDIPINGKRQ